MTARPRLDATLQMRIAWSRRSNGGSARAKPPCSDTCNSAPYANLARSSQEPSY